MSIENRLQELGLELPAVTAAKFSYVPYRLAGDIAYLSGQVSKEADGASLTGKVGADCTADEGREAARRCALQLLAVAKSITGSLDDIEFVKVFGMVNAAPDFAEQASVVEGCSQLLVEVMGDRGQHARSAVGMGSLPGNVRVEIEAIVRVLR